MNLYTILNHELELVPSFTQPSLNTDSNLNTTRDINNSTFPGVISDGASELIKEQLFSSTPNVVLPEAEGAILDFLSALF